MQKPEYLRYAIKTTLSDLKLDYLDLYLLHWPIRGRPTEFPTNCNALKDSNGNVVIDTSFTLQDTWSEMESLVSEGLVKHIGVSNYTLPLLQELLSFAKIKPAVNQYERHPYLPQPELLAFCKENGILVTAYSPLGLGLSASPCLLTDETIVKIAEKHGCTPAQVLINWQVDSGCSVIPKTSSAKRVKENFARVPLDKEDMEMIEKIETRKRFGDPMDFWGYKLFDDKF